MQVEVSTFFCGRIDDANYNSQPASVVSVNDEAHLHELSYTIAFTKPTSVVLQRHNEWNYI